MTTFGRATGSRPLVGAMVMNVHFGRWVASADAVQGVEQKAKDLLAQVDAHRELSSSLAHDDPSVNV